MSMGGGFRSGGGTRTGGGFRAGGAKNAAKAAAKRRKNRVKRKLKCRFCTSDGCPRPVYVDYKDLRTLKLMINREGNLISRRRTGNCAKYQRAVRHAVLRARFMALLPYVERE